MEKADIKTIKEVNGRKVIHPFQAGNIVYSFLILLLVAFPVGIFFTPLVMFGGFNPEGALNGLEMFKYFAIDFWSMATPTSGILGVLSTASNEVMEAVYRYVMLGQTAILGVFMIVSVASLIIFIVSMAKGYLRHPRSVKSLAVLDFVFSIIFSLSFLFFYIMTVINQMPQALFVWLAFVPMGGMLIFLIIISIVYTHNYSDCLYESDLEFHEDDTKEVVTTHVTEVHEVTKVNYEQPNTLPPDITSIGGHEFSANQNLQIANIPVGITSLGNSAFSNCLNLRVVSLPDSVKEIGYNCFFNCVSLERLNYAGTKEQWRHIKRGSNWLAKAKTTEVVCVDGPIIVNPYH